MVPAHWLPQLSYFISSIVPGSFSEIRRLSNVSAFAYPHDGRAGLPATAMFDDDESRRSSRATTDRRRQPILSRRSGPRPARGCAANDARRKLLRQVARYLGCRHLPGRLPRSRNNRWPSRWLVRARGPRRNSARASASATIATRQGPALARLAAGLHMVGPIQERASESATLRPR